MILHLCSYLHPFSLSFFVKLYPPISQARALKICTILRLFWLLYLMISLFLSICIHAYSGSHLPKLRCTILYLIFLLLLSNPYDDQVYSSTFIQLHADVVRQYQRRILRSQQLEFLKVPLNVMHTHNVFYAKYHSHQRILLQARAMAFFLSICERVRGSGVIPEMLKIQKCIIPSASHIRNLRRLFFSF